MIDVNLQQLANQELTITLENARYVLRVVETNSSMALTIIKDDVTFIQNALLMANDFQLRTNLVDPDSGNFFFDVQNESLPDWRQFGVTQFLRYLTSDELEAL